jgi:hypothetical protein
VRGADQAAGGRQAAEEPLTAAVPQLQPGPAASLGLTILTVFEKPPDRRGGGGFGLGLQGLGRRSQRSLSHAPSCGHRVPGCVRRRRPRLRARCEGGADGEEEGVGLRAPPLPNPGPLPEPSPWRPKERGKDPAPRFFRTWE